MKAEASLPAEALRRRRTRVATAAAFVLTVVYFGRQVALELMLEAHRTDSLMRSRYIGYSLGPLLLALLVVAIAVALPGGSSKAAHPLSSARVRSPRNLPVESPPPNKAPQS